MRKSVIAGNWKMNNTVTQGIKLVQDLIPLVQRTNTEVIICPSFICLDSIVKVTQNTNIKVGAQNMHFEDNGAYTGEISPVMLKELGVDYVVLGHSERRQYFNESDNIINKKIVAAFNNNIIPILCVGETLIERDSNITNEIIGRQIKLGLIGIEKELVRNIIIAYEPIWAIGTGKTATSEDANNTIGYIRGIVAEMFGEDVSCDIRILYGGSVKSSTIKEQMAMEHIDGGLVGGASLNAEEFAKIVNYYK